MTRILPVLAAGLMAVGPLLAGAQDPPLPHDTGQTVVPFYEGWYTDTDGSLRVSFGYLNRNFRELVDIPIGPNNRIEPGPADQGQPTHFETRRQTGVFTLVVPKGTKTELKWTLAHAGVTTTIPAVLSPLYEIFALKKGGTRPAGGGLPVDNAPPSVRFHPAGAKGVGPAGVTTTQNATVNMPMPLELYLEDDGLPDRGGKPIGLTVGWSKYRGAGAVKFTSAVPVPARGGNAAQKASTTVTFGALGEYTLRVLVSDGSGFNEQCCWTNGYVKVVVGGASEGPTSQRK